MNLSEKRKWWIHLIADIVISLLLCISAILLGVSCWSIYRSAEAQMFTYARISAAFSKIALPIYLTLLASLAGGVLSIALPRDEKRLKGKRSLRVTHASLLARAPISAANAEQRQALQKEQKLRRILQVANLVLFALSAILPLFYLLDPGNYLGSSSKECTAEVLRCILVYAVSLLPVFLYQFVYFHFTERSLAKEIELFKSLTREHGAAPAAAKPTANILTKNESKITWGVRAVILAAAALLIVLGIANGGMAEVLKKAAEICAECIGLG